MADGGGSGSTLDGIIDRTEEDRDRLCRRRRWGYRVVAVVVFALPALAVADGLGLVEAVGVDSDTVRGSGGGYELAVRYPVVARPALAIPFEIEVRHPGGFDGPITLSARSDYFDLFDENGLDPDLSASTQDHERVIWEFDPPPGDVLTVSLDTRVEPARQNGESGRVELLVEDEAVITVDFHTRLLP